MTEVATPSAEVKETTAPAAPAPAPEATPAPAPAATPAPAAAPVAEETVTIPKSLHDQLARDAARTASVQRKADLYDRHFGKGGSGHFQPTAPATPPTAEELKIQADAEDRKAERGIAAIAADPEFREVLDADPTLRNLMISNPLAVLPILAPDALDAEDAMNLVKESLNGRKKPATPPAPAPAAPATPPAPPAGAVTTPGDQTVDEAVEEARKNPNTENAIAGMIGAKVRQGK